MHPNPSEILISYSHTLSALLTALVDGQWCAKSYSVHVVVVGIHAVDVDMHEPLILVLDSVRLEARVK